MDVGSIDRCLSQKEKVLLCKLFKIDSLPKSLLMNTGNYSLTLERRNPTPSIKKNNNKVIKNEILINVVRWKRKQYWARMFRSLQHDTRGGGGEPFIRISVAWGGEEEKFRIISPIIHEPTTLILSSRERDAIDEKLIKCFSSGQTLPAWLSGAMTGKDFARFHQLIGFKESFFPGESIIKPSWNVTFRSLHAPLVIDPEANFLISSSKAR